MTTKVEILEDAKATIQKGWCQRDSAVDEDGKVIPPWDSGACKWCVTGALMKSIHQITGVDISWFYNQLHQEEMPEGIEMYNERCARIEDSVGCTPSVWNDAGERTQEDVVQVLERLIEQGEET